MESCWGRLLSSWPKELEFSKTLARETHIAIDAPTALEGAGEVPSLAPQMPNLLQVPPPVASAPDLSALIARARTLVQKAGAADLWEQPRLAEQINDCFEELAERGGGRPAADFLVQQLEAGGLSSLEAPSGQTCRASAAQALVGLGYPFALEVSPEDLQHLRAEESRRGRYHPLALYPPLAVAAVNLIEAGAGELRGELVLGSVAGGLLAALGHKGGRLRALGLGLLASVGLASAAMAFASDGWTHAATAAGAALALGVALWRPRP
jgi:hypothetical protein